MRGKLKGFPGAPEKYELSVPDAMKEQMQWTTDDPLLGRFQAFAKENGMSQQMFTGLLHMFAEHEFSQQSVDFAREKTLIGERADERMGSFEQWAGANLSEEQMGAVLAPLGKNARPSDVFKAYEILLNANRAPAMHREGDDVPAGGPATQAEWQAKWYAKSTVPGCQYKIDEPGQRVIARRESESFAGTGDHIEIVGKGGGRGARRG